MVAENLSQENVQIRFSSFGEAARYVSMRGYQCSVAPPMEFAWNMEGSFSVKQSIANIPIWFTNFSRQVNHEIRVMTQYGPDVIVSDSRLSPLFAAKLLGVPSIVLLNQLRLLLSPRLRQFRISRLFEKTTGEFLGMMWNTADRILIPDLPPPYTISADNIWDIDAAGKLEYVGFTAPKPQISREQVDKVVEDLGFDRSRPIVFFHISGPAETRMPMIRICLEAAKGLKDIQYVFSEGRANGSTEPRKIGSDGRYYEWCPVRDEVFAMSDLIVLRGGHTALSQAIQFGKPVVTIPIENHGEQLGNSVKVASLGLGVMVHPKKIRPEQITRGVEEALSNPEYRRKTEQVRKMTDELNGIDNVVKIIRSYL